MRKYSHFIFVVVIALCVGVYFRYSEAAKAFVFNQVQKHSAAEVPMQNIIFLNDDFSVANYSTFITRMKTLDNSVALFLPQLYDMKIEGYIDSFDINEIKKIKDDYRNLTLSLAETKNIIPVAFIQRGLKQLIQNDMSAYSYFDSKNIKLKLIEYVSAKEIAKKAWYMMSGVSFYEEYVCQPFTIPVIMKFHNSVLVSASVEAIRRYYKFTRDRVTYTDGMIKIGDVIDFPLLKNGDIIIHRLKAMPKIYTLNEFINADNYSMNDKIIIVKNKEISQDTMYSLGIMTASIMKGKYIGYNTFVNYLGIFIILILLIAAYRSFRFWFGLLVLIVSESIFFVISVLFMSNNSYLDLTLMSALNLLSFAAIYYFRISNLFIDRHARLKVISRFMHPNSVKPFVLKNKDIQIKNNWFKTFIMYINFEEEDKPNAIELKQTFGKVRDLIYTKHKDFLIKGHNNRDILIVILEDSNEARSVIKTALEIRAELSKLKFNLVLHNTEAYIFENGNELGIFDKNYSLLHASEILDKKKYIVIPEIDVKKYINIIKFQKITGTGATVLFNVTGLREDQTNEN